MIRHCLPLELDAGQAVPIKWGECKLCNHGLDCKFQCQRTLPVALRLSLPSRHGHWRSANDWTSKLGRVTSLDSTATGPVKDPLKKTKNKLNSTEGCAALALNSTAPRGFIFYIMSRMSILFVSQWFAKESLGHYYWWPLICKSWRAQSKNLALFRPYICTSKWKKKMSSDSWLPCVSFPLIGCSDRHVGLARDNVVGGVCLFQLYDQKMVLLVCRDMTF